MKALFDAIQEAQPRFNEEVCSGLSTEHMKGAQEYVDRVWKCAAADFPPNLKYIGYDVCDPYEAALVAPIRIRTRRLLELSKTNCYLVKYFLELDGKPLKPVYLYLPYLDPGNLFWNRGARYRVSPSLIDPGLSVCEDHVFIGINRASLTFRRAYHTIVVNGRTDSSDFVYSNLYNNSAARRSANSSTRPVKMEASCGHYMFCKYGVTEAFRRQGAPNVKVVTSLDEYQGLDYNEHVVITASPFAPKGLGRARHEYVATKLKLIIPIDEWTVGVKTLATTFFYVVDHFSDLVTREEIDDTTMWSILMGHVIFRSNRSDIRLAADIEEHIYNLDGYIDVMAKENFASLDLGIEDIYDLFVYMMDSLSTLISNVNNRQPLLYGKEVAVNSYVLKEITKAIFNFMFRFKPGTGILATPDGVERAIRRNLRSRSVTRDWYLHSEVSYISTPGDNLVHEITTKAVQQSTGMLSTGPRVRTRSLKVDHTTVLNESFSEVGCINATDRNDPIGTSKLNQFVMIENDTIMKRS